MDDEKHHLAIAVLLQVFAIVAGFLGLGIVMWINGWPEEVAIRWNPLARGLRQYGVWLLVVPLVWAVITGLIWNVQQGELILGIAIGFGYVFAIVILILFVWAAMDSFRWSLLLPLKRTAAAVARPDSESQIHAAAGYVHQQSGSTWAGL